MALTYEITTILQQAYYLANILSVDRSETMTTEQEAQAKLIYDQIADSMMGDPFLSSYVAEYQIEVTSRFIYIINNPSFTTPIESDSQIVYRQQFSSIMSASVIVGTTRNPLEIHPLTDRDRTYITDSDGIPRYLYWSISSLFQEPSVTYTGDPTYNLIYLYPKPTTTYNLIIRGAIMFPQSDVGSPGTTSLPSFESYMVFAVGKRLAMYWNKGQEWAQQGKEAEFQKLEEVIRKNSSMASDITNTEQILNRSSNYYITTSST